MGSVVGGTLFVTKKDGIKSAKIIAQKGSELTLDKDIGIEADDVWVIHSKVSTRLFRAVGITENADEGTYTISAVRHDPNKYGVVDSWADFPTTVNTADQVTIDNPTVTNENGQVVVGWDGTLNGSYVAYDVKVYRNGKLYRHIPDATTPKVELSGLPDGIYKVEIRGKTITGSLSEPHIITFVINYDITGLRATPLLWSIKLDWVLPETLASTVVTEIFSATVNNLEQAKLLASVPYPLATYTLTGVGLSDEFYFWVRLKDDSGRAGQFTESVVGRSSSDPDLILEQLTGQLTFDQFKPGAADGLLSDLDDLAGDSTQNAGDGLGLAGQYGALSQITELNYAQQKQLSAVRAQVNENIATVGEQLTVLADDQKAQAEKLEVVSSRVGENSAAVTQVAQSFADLSGKLSASWQVQVSIQDGVDEPVVGGIQLGVDGTSRQSEFVVQADRFAVWSSKKIPVIVAQDGIVGINGDLVVAGTLSGKLLIGNELRGGRINGGSLNIGNGRFFVDDWGNVYIRDTANVNRGMQITNQTITVFDDSGNVRLRLGRL